MHYLHDLKDRFCNELEEYANKAKSSGKMSGGDIEAIHLLTDTVKNILKVIKLEDECGYSEESRYMGEGRIYGTSYDRGSSYDRDGMGRYSRDGNGYSTKHYVRGHYSRDDGKQYMVERLQEMMEKAEKPAEREVLERCMKAFEK